MPLVLNGATSGSTTVQATDAVTATLTLPQSTGTLLSTANPQSGGVIQVVQGSTSTQVSSNTTNSWVDTTLSATITPKFSTSKILVIVAQSCEVQVTNGDAQGNLQLLRGATSIYGAFGYDQIRLYGTSSGSAALGFNFPITYLDSPATTSATTYKTQFSLRGGSIMYVQLSPQISYITLLEIAA